MLGSRFLMGLFGFSWTMLSAYFVLLSDKEYKRLGVLMARWREWLRTHMGTGFAGAVRRYLGAPMPTGGKEW